jgi:uncharacterized protein YndB with AHSA1/START domain
MDDYGKITAPDTVRIERLFPGPIERVWAYLTESQKRGKWLASGAMELREGGKVELRFFHADLSAEKEPPEKFQKYQDGHVSHGTVLRCEPPRHLTFTWGDNSEVNFELSEEEGKVRLVLTHRRLPDRRSMISVASGWHSHLAILSDQLANVDPRPFWTTILQTEAEYEVRFSEERK